MSRLNVSNLFNENEDGAPVVSGISTFSSPHYFVPPSGSTAQRPQDPGEGMIRFNTDSGHLEYYTGTHWADVIVNNNELGGSLTGAATTFSTNGTGTRGLTGGGYTSSKQDVIDYLTISTLGNSQDFGNLTASRYWISSCSSTTRGIWGGGGVAPTSPNKSDIIDFVTISSTGNATDFGNLVQARYGLASCSNRTRGLFCGGYQVPGSQVNHIDYITIAQTGNAVDFGDLTVSRYYLTATATSVRGVVLSGRTGTSPYTYYNTIDYMTIASTANAQDFGDLTNLKAEGYAAANSTRGLYISGYDNGTATNAIVFVTIASTGNAQDFGDITENVVAGSAAASPTRAVAIGGYQQPSPGTTGTMQFVTIATTGNATDFGDMSAARYVTGSCSNGHGGL